MTEHIEHRLEDGITYITINDPKNGNRVSDPMAEELSLQIDAASETSKAVGSYGQWEMISVCGVLSWEKNQANCRKLT